MNDVWLESNVLSKHCFIKNNEHHPQYNTNNNLVFIKNIKRCEGNYMIHLLKKKIIKMNINGQLVILLHMGMLPVDGRGQFSPRRS